MKSWLKAQHSENEDHGIWSHHFMGNRCGNSADFIFGGFKITEDGDCSHEIKRRLLLGRKVMTNLDIQKQRRYFANKSLSSQGYGFSSGQSIGVSASASVPPMNIQDWFPLGWTSLISLQSKGLSRIFLNTTVQKHHFFSIQPSLWSNWHPYMTTEKTIALAIQTFVDKVMSLL